MSWLVLAKDPPDNREFRGTGKGQVAAGTGTEWGRSYLRLPQGLVDPALPALARCSKLVQNVAVDAQSNLLLRPLRFRPPRTAAQLRRHQFRTNLISRAHPTELRIREWWIVRVVAIQYRVTRTLKKASRPLSRFGTQPCDFLQLPRSQSFSSLRHTSAALLDSPFGD